MINTELIKSLSLSLKKIGVESAPFLCVNMAKEAK